MNNNKLEADLRKVDEDKYKLYYQRIVSNSIGIFIPAKLISEYSLEEKFDSGAKIINASFENLNCDILKEISEALNINDDNLLEKSVSLSFYKSDLENIKPCYKGIKVYGDTTFYVLEFILNKQ